MRVALTDLQCISLKTSHRGNFNNSTCHLYQYNRSAIIHQVWVKTAAAMFKRISIYLWSTSINYYIIVPSKILFLINTCMYTFANAHKRIFVCGQQQRVISGITFALSVNHFNVFTPLCFVTTYTHTCTHTHTSIDLAVCMIHDAPFLGLVCIYCIQLSRVAL